MERSRLLPTSIRLARFVTRNGHYNVRAINLKFRTVLGADLYHFILNLAIWKIMLMLATLFLVINIVFGSLYYLGRDGIGHPGTGDTSFWDCFYFSVQTMSTIGYGNLYPLSHYVQILVVLESFFGMIVNSLVVVLTLAKISRPSHVACINRKSPYFKEPPRNIGKSKYDGTYERGLPVLSFRVLNMRKRQLCESKINVFLLERRILPDGMVDFQLHELNYELNRQIGRSRELNWSMPRLPLPWVITHTIDEKSPLYRYLRPESLGGDHEIEIVCTFEGIDELTSHNFIRSWSFLPHEVAWDHEFVPMLRVGHDGVVESDLDCLSEVRPCQAIN